MAVGIIQEVQFWTEPQKPTLKQTCKLQFNPTIIFIELEAFHFRFLGLSLSESLPIFTQLRLRVLSAAASLPVAQ